MPDTRERTKTPPNQTDCFSRSFLQHEGKFELMDLIRFDGVEEPDMEGCRKISTRSTAFFLFYMFYIVFWVIFIRGFLWF